ncbi:hypothetical protein K456DRAFT_58911 [Colletotrichum gloeosporioides 23]|nr:hypothetical protein K456DRAFT_58911 [Colletotrichum gloeosporioides 23]
MPMLSLSGGEPAWMVGALASGACDVPVPPGVKRVDTLPFLTPNSQTPRTKRPPLQSVPEAIPLLHPQPVQVELDPRDEMRTRRRLAPEPPIGAKQPVHARLRRRRVDRRGSLVVL